MWVLTRWEPDPERSIEEPRTGFLRLALLTAVIGTGSMYHMELAYELVAVRCTSIAM